MFDLHPPATEDQVLITNLRERILFFCPSESPGEENVFLLSFCSWLETFRIH